MLVSRTWVARRVYRTSELSSKVTMIWTLATIGVGFVKRLVARITNVLNLESLSVSVVELEIISVFWHNLGDMLVLLAVRLVLTEEFSSSCDKDAFGLAFVFVKIEV